MSQINETNYDNHVGACVNINNFIKHHKVNHISHALMIKTAVSATLTKHVTLFS